MICPKCMREQFVSPIGEHYICIQDGELQQEETGCGTQFKCIVDEKIKFPHNVIFNERGKNEFYRKPYLELTPVGFIADI